MTIQKHQLIRILDVVLIGPLMIYASKSKDFRDDVKAALLLFGVATIIYNGRNFWLEEKLRRKNEL